MHISSGEVHGADLNNVNLSALDGIVDLSGADLSGTILIEAHLSGADLRGVLNNKSTVWPSAFDPEKDGAIFEE